MEAQIWLWISVGLAATAVGMLVYFNLSARPSTQPRIVKLRRKDVAAALEDALKGEGGWAQCSFEDFLENPIEDPELERLRLECLQVLKKSGSIRPGSELTDVAEAWIRAKLQELR